MKTLKMALDYRLILEKVHMVIEFNEDAMLKPYIEMNTELRKKAKIYLEKELMKLKENSVLEKTMERTLGITSISNLWHLAKEETSWCSEPNYHAAKHFSEKPLVFL